MTAEVVGTCKTCGVPLTSTQRGFVYDDGSIECEPCRYEGPPTKGVSEVTSEP